MRSSFLILLNFKNSMKSKMKKLIALSLLSVMIVLNSAGAVFAQAGTRVRFARGRTSTTVSSTIKKNAERKFILGARAGQTLSANISSRNGCVVLGNQQTSESYTTDKGDNWIDVINNCGNATTFTLTVSIY